MRIAVGRREGPKDRFAVLKRGGRCADHQAVAELEAPDSAARPDVHELDPLLLQGLGAAQRVREVRVAAVDDDVALGEMWHELLDRVLDWRTGRYHDPDDSPRGQLSSQISKIFGALGTLADM